MNFKEGQIFTDEYPPEAAQWCNDGMGEFCISEIEPEEGRRRFVIERSPVIEVEPSEDPMESVDAALCELYERQLEQSAIIDSQDDAICALYEMLGGK